MIKDGRDTTVKRLKYYPHYWVNRTSDNKLFVLMRTTNNKDTIMVNEDGTFVSGTYAELYNLARKLTSDSRKA